MDKYVLLFYNKSNNKKIGYYIFDGIVNHVYFASHFFDIMIDVENYLHTVFNHPEQYSESVKRKLHPIPINDIGYKYVEYNIELRRLKINKLKEKFL